MLPLMPESRPALLQPPTPPSVFTPRVLRGDGISLWDCWLALCTERIGSEIPFSATTTYPCSCVVSFKQRRLALHACNLGDKDE